MKKPVVIFDFDGTIVDSLTVVAEIFEQLSGKLGQLSKAELAELRHLPVKSVARKLDVPVWRIPYLLVHGRQLMSKRIGELTTMPGIAELINRLRSSGYKLLIVSSNSRRNIRTFLKHHHLESCFSDVYGNVGLFNKARALNKVLRRRNLNPADCLYVCDEARDIEACRAVGLPCVAVTWGFGDPQYLAKLKPSRLVTSCDELLDEVTSINKKIGSSV